MPLKRWLKPRMPDNTAQAQGTGKGCHLAPAPATQVQVAMLTGAHPFCSKTVTFLPSSSARPAFRRINRREIAGLVGIADMPKFLKPSLADFGLAS
jgi:hypothetical protein